MIATIPAIDADGGIIATIPVIDANGGTVAIDSIHGVDNELNEKAAIIPPAAADDIRCDRKKQRCCGAISFIRQSMKKVTLKV
jgi:hypothetical protein